MDGMPANQSMGSVEAVPGRYIVFPNTYQHRVKSFELLDKTKLGHRKILCFFLVNPQKRVLSTKDVPPQQFSWWFAEVFSDPCSALSRFPLDVRLAIAEFFDWPMKEAGGGGETVEVEEDCEDDFVAEVSLCEH